MNKHGKVEGSAKRYVCSKLFPYLIIFILTGCTSILLFSNFWYSYSTNKTPSPSSLCLSDATIAASQKGETATINDQGAHIPASGATIRFAHVHEQIKGIKITAKSDGSNQYVSGSVWIEDSSNAPGLSYADDIHFTTDKYNNSIARVNSTGNAKTIEIRLDGTGSTVNITDIEANPHVSPKISVLKWGVLFLCVSLIWFIYDEKLYLLTYNIECRNHNIVYGITCIFCLVISLAIGFGIFGMHHLTISYPDEITNDQYAMQYYAWRHGSTALLEQPPEAWLKLNNPYSPAARSASNQSGLYDVVLYNGKYYVYFGVTPLLILYAPFNIIFPHHLPSASLATMCFALLSILALFLALRELLILFEIRPNFVALIAVALALPSASLVFYLQACAAIYYIPLLSAMAFCALCIFFGLRAARCHTSWRRPLFVLAGLSFALQLGSRPNSVLATVFFIAPLFISILFDAVSSYMSKIKDALAFLLPACSGLTAQLLYNKVRFNSPFNFGNAIQLTNDDLRDNTLSFDPLKLKDMILNYFLMPFQIKSDFPYIEYQGSVMSGYGNYFYQHYMFGILMFPIAWGIFLIFSRCKKTKIELWMCGSGLLGSVLLGYINYAIAGSIFRYYCDFIIIFMLIASAQLLRFAQPKMTTQKDGPLSLYIPILLMCIVSTIFGLLLVFSQHPEPYSLIEHVNPDVFLAVARFFDVGL